MDLDTLLSYEWSVMTPEFIILAMATGITLLDLFMPKTQNRKMLGVLAVMGICAALLSLVGLLDLEVTSILEDTFRLDTYAKAFKLLLLLGAALVLLLAVSYEPKEGMNEVRGEFYYLFLTALLGAMIMTSSGDLITLFVGLELLTISSYILAGLRKKHVPSNEAAMKYVVNGGISTAVTLFGLSYVYGLTGTTNIAAMRNVLLSMANEQYLYLLTISFLMVFVGLSFKIAAAPFHMWAADVYQGAPTPVMAFLSVISKTAGFVLLVRIVISIFAMDETLLSNMQDYIGFIAGATMVIGNLVALRQRNMKRLLGFSSIAHAGYMLVAMVSMSIFMFDSMWFYLLAYLFMNIGILAIVQIVSEKSETEDISAIAGLYHRSPLLAVSMLIMILSLAGIPGTAGFIGKLNIIMGALIANPAHYVLVSIMIATTVISYVYYFGLAVQIFFRPTEHGERIKLPIGAGIVVGVCAIATILFGLFPNLALDFLQTNFHEFGDFLR